VSATLPTQTPSSSTPSALGAELPCTIIRPGGGGLRAEARELWEFRELLLFLVWRNVKIRYKQTALGASWAVLQPLLLMVVFTIFLGRLGGIESKLPSELPYPVFAFAALVPWTLFAQGIANGADSLVGNSNLVSKIYFPRLLLPLAAICSFLVDFVIALAVLVALMLAYGVAPPGVEVLLIVPLTLLALATSVAVGVGLAAVNVRFRDVRYAVPFLVQLWLFASPIAYPASQVPESWRLVYGLNPMAGVVEGFRWALLGQDWSPGPMIAVSVGVTCLLLVVSALYFVRTERTFADIV
jgi:lipopolysaccharide transport system permease protein